MTYVFRFSASDGSTSASRASESGEDYFDSSYSRYGSSQTRSQHGAPQKWPQIFEKENEEAETEREFKTDTALQPRAAAPASRAVSPLFPSPCTGFLLSAATLGACAAADRTGESGDECAAEQISVLVGSEELEIALTMRKQLTEHALSMPIALKSCARRLRARRL